MASASGQSDDQSGSRNHSTAHVQTGWLGTGKIRALITGASGFVGSHLVRYLLEVRPDWELVLIVGWKHKGAVPERLCEDPRFNAALEAGRVQMITHDLAAALSDTSDLVRAIGAPVDILFHIASHANVEESLREPTKSITANVDLQLGVLELARALQPHLRVFLHMSTNEVYGASPGNINQKEWDPIIPPNPYAAGKAAQEALAISYWRTYKVPLIILNTMCVFGEGQEGYKFFSLCVDRVLSGTKISIHSYPDGRKASSRRYIHARELADATLWIAERMPPVFYPGEHERVHEPHRFHVVGELEIDNLSVAKRIAEILERPLNYELIDFHSSRPGHDLRFSLDDSKIRSLGWQQPRSFDEGLRGMVLDSARRIQAAKKGGKD